MTSTNSPTDQQLAAIDAREKAATPGPWTAWADTYPHLVLQGPKGVHPAEATGIISTNLAVNEIADAAFIAHARTDVPALLDEVRRQRARMLTESEYSAAWHAVEGAAGEEGADPGTVLHAVLDRLGITWTSVEQPAVEEAEACGKCRQPFDPADTRFDGQARFQLTAYCRGCVDRCHDNEIADHRCVICA